jgi:hypothetical protein
MNNGDEAPHIFVVTFERLILFPLRILFLGEGVFFLIKRAWLFGAFLFLISFFFSMIGVSLPHRKKQTFKELCSQKVGERFGNITDEESYGLAKAMMLTGFLVSVIAAGTALHRDLPWYWVLACFAGTWAVFPIGSFLFCFAWSWMLEKISKRSKLEAH